MTHEKVARAEEIIKELSSLKSFAHSLGSVPEGRIKMRNPFKMIVSTVKWWIFDEEEIVLKGDLKNRVQRVILERVAELEKEFEEL
jgi:hypothetical protein